MPPLLSHLPLLFLFFSLSSLSPHYQLISHALYSHSLSLFTVGEDVQFLGDNPLFTIPAGATMATLRGVAIVDDIIFEGDESFIVEIVSLSFGVVGNGATQVEIIDDDGKFIIILYQTPLIPTPMGQKCNVQVLQEAACSWVLTKVSIVKTS